MRVRLICIVFLTALVALILSGCAPTYSQEYVEELRNEIHRLEDEVVDLEHRIDNIYGEFALDLELASKQVMDADDVIFEMQDSNASYDAVNFADTTYRRAVDALYSLCAKYSA